MKKKKSILVLVALIYSAIGFGQAKYPFGGSVSTDVAVAPGLVSSINNVSGFTTIVSSSTVYTLTATSNGNIVVTGSTNQTIQMPVASTCILGQQWNLINNGTPGITPATSTGSAFPSVFAGPGTVLHVQCVLLSGTTSASWVWWYSLILSNSGEALPTSIIQSSLQTVGTLTGGTASTGFNLAGVTADFGSDAKGDIYINSGSSNVIERLGIGSSGQVLGVSGGLPSWQSAGGSGTVTSITAGAQLTGGTITTGGTIALATTAVSANSYGSSTSIPSFTVNAYGQLTAASGNAVVAPAGTLSGTTLNSTVVTSSLTSLGAVVTGTWTATPVGLGYYTLPSLYITPGSGGYTIGGAGTTLQGAFFSNTIKEIVVGHQVYFNPDDFTQTSSTLTWINGMVFDASHNIIAKLD